MKSNLSILTLAGVLCLAAFSGLAQQPENSQGESTQGIASSEGNKLVNRAARQMLALPSLTATVHQQIKLFDREITGSGKYRQFAGGAGWMRLDLKLTEGKHLVAIITQSLQADISPGAGLLPVEQRDVFFTQVKHPWHKQATRSRVDMDRVHDAVGAAAGSPGVAGGVMPPGGLSRMLTGLAENFQFQSPQATTYRDVPVWILQGSWRPEKLIPLLPKHKEAILAGQPAPLEELPFHLPGSVRLTLGRDELFGLFPYRIEYFRGPTPTGEPIVGIEFSQVQQRGDLRPSDYRYDPGDEKVVDITAQYIQRLKAGGDRGK